jgi:hypothetical protein
MKFRHAIRLRPLMADDDDDVTAELIGLEGRLELLLAFEDSRRSSEDKALRLHCRCLDHGPTEIPLQQGQSSRRLERIVDRPDDRRLECFAANIAVRELAVLQPRLASIG